MGRFNTGTETDIVSEACACQFESTQAYLNMTGKHSGYFSLKSTGYFAHLSGGMLPRASDPHQMTCNPWAVRTQSILLGLSQVYLAWPPELQRKTIRMYSHAKTCTCNGVLSATGFGKAVECCGVQLERVYKKELLN